MEKTGVAFVNSFLSALLVLLVPLTQGNLSWTALGIAGATALTVFITQVQQLLNGKVAQTENSSIQSFY